MRAFEQFIAASQRCNEATANFLAISRAAGPEPSAKERNDFVEADRICRERHEEFLAAAEALHRADAAI